MNPLRQSTLVLPSVVDRLLDDHPGNAEFDSQARFDLAKLKASLARDLEALLNTRIIEIEDDDQSFSQTKASILQYGIPDLSGLSLLNPLHREQLQARLQSAIAHHEPRLATITVELDAPRDLERQLRFKVDAVLKAYPQHPSVSFDATLQLTSNVYQVRS